MTHYMESPKHMRIKGDAKEITRRINSGEARVTDIAKEYKTSKDYICKVRKNFMGDDYYPARKDMYSKDEIDFVLMLYAEGWNARQIAEKLDDGEKERSHHSVRQIINKHAPKPNYPSELRKASARAIHHKDVELDGESMYMINYLKRKPYAVIPLQEYLKLKSNSTNNKD